MGGPRRVLLQGVRVRPDELSSGLSMGGAGSHSAAGAGSFYTLSAAARPVDLASDAAGMAGGSEIGSGAAGGSGDIGSRLANLQLGCGFY